MSNTQLYRSILGARKPSIIGLLNTPEGAGAAAAYSLRMLNADLIGQPVILVRRSSDNAEQDINLTKNGVDTVALLEFVGDNDGFVVTWYDQSGNGRDVVQTTASRQPLIVSDGSIITSSGRHSVFFDRGLSNNLQANFTTLPTASGVGMYVVVDSEEGAISLTRSVALYGTAQGGFAGSSAVGSAIAISGSNNQYDLYIAGSGAVRMKDITTNKEIIGGFYNKNEGVVKSYDRGVITNTANRNTDVLGQGRIIIGASGSGVTLNYEGNISELILYLGDLADNSVKIQENQEEYYEIL